MTKVSVWAPEVRQLELECAGRRRPMVLEADGWWSIDAPELIHGRDYAFRLDEKGPFPDPRSPWQPNGIHEPSRWLDHQRFQWHDSDWQAPPFSSALIYELHVGTFTPEGTFDAVIDKLNYLKDLGITHLQLMPVAEFSGKRGWGYDGVDLYAPYHAYGGPEGLKRMVDACHCKGLAVIIDVVYNHLGPSGNYLGRYGPYFTDTYHTPWGEGVNFDKAHSDTVRRFFLDNALMWIEDYHCDGLRIDAVHAIFDTSAIHFLEALAREVHIMEERLGRQLVVIAESDLNDPRVVRETGIGGYGLDAQWNDDFHHALHALLTGERDGYYEDFGLISDLATAMTQGLVYDGRYSKYRKRSHGRPATDLPGRRFVGYLQNHDQVGNRAMGERSAQLLSNELLKVGAALVMMSPFVPLLFQGEEWGADTPFLYFTDHDDPKLAEAVRKGRSREFGLFEWDPECIPDPQAPDTLTRSRLDWNQLTGEPYASLLRWHRDLIALRRAHPVFCNDRLEQVRVNFVENENWLMMRRGEDLCELIVACNFGMTPRTLEYPARRDPHILLASDPRVSITREAIWLPAQSVAIFDLDLTANTSNCEVS